MRLDHLLSKEHISATRHIGECGCGRDRLVPNRGTADAHGWNADKHPSRVLPAFVLVVRGVISTHCWVLREHVSVFLLGNKTTRLSFSHTAEHFSWDGFPQVVLGSGAGVGLVLCVV